jgi:hypothetical protein
VAHQIPFYLGELLILHGCNPFLPDEEAVSISTHPLQLKVLHFT